MKKFSRLNLGVILILSIQNSVCNEQLQLLKSENLTYFPSASAIEFYNNHLYVIGDDATQLLVLDGNYKVVDSITIFKSSERRIPKNIKPDLEASNLLEHNKTYYLLAFGSLSTTEREKVFVLQMNNRDIDTLNISAIKHKLKELNIPEVNIEGAAIMKEQLILSNRANTTHTTNHLISIPHFSPDSISADAIHITSMIFPKEKEVKGISGLAYLPGKDLLLFTASVEETPDAISDGAISDSYIGYISKASQKLTRSTVEPDKIINLSTVLKGKRKYKIESIAIEKATGNILSIHLAADNDNGESTLFKLNWKL
ncbi:MAG: hypothetical protein ABR502_05300 [Chitinophagaceae bacterium]